MITANIFFNRIRGLNQPRVSTWEDYRRLVLVPEMAHLEIPEQGYDETSEPLTAYVNWGHWRVKCECGCTEFAWEEGRFMCRSCYNGKHGHKYRRAIFPRDREKIEAILKPRPLENRNWRPGETLAFLRAENKQHKGELLNGVE